jgi:endonuclease/exonuclease/phosphatase family metal-dependent hydrolase
VLNYSQTTDSSRDNALRRVVAAIDPDILVTQEIVGNFGSAWFLDDVLEGIEHGRYSLLGFTDGPDSDNSLYFKAESVEYLGSIQRATDLREIDGWILRIRATDDTIRVYSAHLKAGDTPDDEQQRYNEARILRQHLDSLPIGSMHLVAGNLNSYSSSDQAYEALTIVGIIAAGEVYDPLASPGNWHNNTQFASLHTQSTRVRQFGGGLSGGMDDRFDHILLSSSLLLNRSRYVTFGNDGQHFNDSINALPNLAVPDSIAQSLHEASDHLPVYLDLVFTKGASGVEEDDTWQRREMDLSDRYSPVILAPSNR